MSGRVLQYLVRAQAVAVDALDPLPRQQLVPRGVRLLQPLGVGAVRLPDLEQRHPVGLPRPRHRQLGVEGLLLRAQLRPPPARRGRHPLGRRRRGVARVVAQQQEGRDARQHGQQLAPEQSVARERVEGVGQEDGEGHQHQQEHHLV